jgi:hypothetical protein
MNQAQDSSPCTQPVQVSAQPIVYYKIYKARPIQPVGHRARAHESNLGGLILARSCAVYSYGSALFQM